MINCTVGKKKKKESNFCKIFIETGWIATFFFKFQFVRLKERVLNCRDCKFGIRIDEYEKWNATNNPVIRLTRRRETNWKMTRFALTWNRKVERKAQLIRISIRFEMEERRMGSRWWWPFLSPSSLLYQHRCLTEFVPWLCVRKSVSLMSFRSSFVIHEIRPNFPLPSLPRPPSLEGEPLWSHFSCPPGSAPNPESTG